MPTRLQKRARDRRLERRYCQNCSADGIVDFLALFHAPECCERPSWSALPLPTVIAPLREGRFLKCSDCLHTQLVHLGGQFPRSQHCPTAAGWVFRGSSVTHLFHERDVMLLVFLLLQASPEPHRTVNWLYARDLMRDALRRRSSFGLIDRWPRGTLDNPAAMLLDLCERLWLFFNEIDPWRRVISSVEPQSSLGRIEAYCRELEIDFDRWAVRAYRWRMLREAMDEAPVEELEPWRDRHVIERLFPELKPVIHDPEGWQVALDMLKEHWGKELKNE